MTETMTLEVETEYAQSKANSYLALAVRTTDLAMKDVYLRCAELYRVAVQQEQTTPTYSQLFASAAL